MKFFFKFLIIFYTIFTSNLYSNTSEIPNEKEFDNPKKEVTTVEAKKNKEHAEMNIKVNKLSIQEIKGYNIGEGKTQYFIPKEEKENKLLKTLTNNTENQYLIFETKEQLSDYLNKNKKAKKKRDIANPIKYEVMQDENQTMLTVNSSAELYILENDNKIYKGNISTYKTVNITDNYDYFILGRKDILQNQAKVDVDSLYLMETKWLDQVQGPSCNEHSNLRYGIKLYHSYHLDLEHADYIGAANANYTKGPYFEISKHQFGAKWYDVKELQDAWSFPHRSWPWNTVIINYYRITIPQGYYSYGHQGIIHTYTTKVVHFTNNDTNIHTITNNIHFFVTRSSREITININSSDLGSQRRLSIHDSKIQNKLNHSEIPSTTPRFRQANSPITIDSTRQNLIFPENLRPGQYRVMTELYYKDEYLYVDDIIYINYDSAIIRGLDLTKAIPNKEYTINLSNGIGKTQEYESNSSLDQNIHQISLGGNLDLSGVSKAELWVNGSHISNNNYNGTSYNVRLSGTNYLYITKNNYSSSSPYIELKLYDSSNNWKRTYRINVTNSTPMRNSSYTAEIDPRFFKVMQDKQERNLYYNGQIKSVDYSKLFRTNGSEFSNIQSIASINNNYNLQNNSSLVTYNGYGFTKNQSPLNGYKDLNGLNLKSSKTQDTVNLLYLGNDNYYQSLNLSLTNNSRDMNKVYNGQGGINLKKASIGTPYTFTSTQLTSGELTLTHKNEFITTGTSFDPNRDIVNKIIVNDNSTSHISGKIYNDTEVKVELGQNNLRITKLKDFTNSKTLKIDYYYNELLLGTYTLRIINTEQTSDVIIDGIDTFNFGSLLPGSSQTLNGQFTISSLSQTISRVDIPKEAQLIKQETMEKIPLTITSSTQKEGDNVKGSISVTANVPTESTPGTYSGTIDLTVTIE